MKTKKRAIKKPRKLKIKPKKRLLTPLQRMYFSCWLMYYSAWLESNEDLLNQELLDTETGDSDFDIPKSKPQPDIASTSHVSISKIFRKLFGPKFKKAVKLMAIIIFLVLVVQIVYPRGRTLPLTRLDGLGLVGVADEQKILNSYNNFDQRIVTVHTHTKNITTSYKDLGITIDPIKTANTITDYPITKRLIPFSILSPTTYSIDRDINDSQLKIFVDDVIALASKQPVDALVTYKDGKFDLTPSEEGFEYQQSELKSVLLNANLSNNAQLVFAPTVLYPNISSDVATSNASRMQQRVKTPLTILADGKSFEIDPSTIQSWVYIKHRPDKKTVEIGFDESKIVDSLRYIPGQVDYPVINTIITYLNGSRAGHKEGTTGRSVKFDELVKLVSGATSPATSSIEAPVETLVPQDVYDRTYSRDSVGVQSLLDYWTSSKGGQYGIEFRTTDGRITAGIDQNRLFASVGVYRLYIASLVYNRIAGGSLYYSTITSNGQSVDACLSSMIVSSDESCTNSLGSIVGWSASDYLLNAQGFESTTLTQNASLSTANDTADWLVKLLNGGITTFSHSSELTNLMSNQIYTSGMPAGSGGIRVADKTGVYGRNVNDVGIVYHPNGTYVLAVYSESSRLSAIAELTRELNKIMYQ